MVVTWASATGSNVGVPAHASVLISGSCSKGRASAFGNKQDARALRCRRYGGNASSFLQPSAVRRRLSSRTLGPVTIIISSMGGRLPPKHPSLLLDMALMTESCVHEQVKRPWNPRNTIPLRDWLTEFEDAESQQRLKALGNVVFPKVAQLGAHLIASEVMRH